MIEAGADRKLGLDPPIRTSGSSSWVGGVHENVGSRLELSIVDGATGQHADATDRGGGVGGIVAVVVGRRGGLRLAR